MDYWLSILWKLLSRGRHFVGCPAFYFTVYRKITRTNLRYCIKRSLHFQAAHIALTLESISSLNMTNTAGAFETNGSIFS